MSHLDDLFRDGLGERKPDVPASLWKKIAASKTPVGEQIDRLFANGLGERLAPVPAGMWARIVAARRPVNYLSYVLGLLLLLITAAGLTWYLGEKNKGPRPPRLSAGLADASQVQSQLEVAEDPDPATTERPGVGRAEPDQRPGVLAGAATLIRPDVQEVTEGDSSIPPTSDGSRVAKESGNDGRSATVIPNRSTVAKGIAVLPIPLLAIIDRSPTPGPIEVQSGNSFRSSHRDRLQGEVLAGIAYANQSFGLQGEASQRLRDLREVSEFPEVSYQITARLRYRLRGRLHLLTGLTYAELRNQIEYDRVLPGGTELVRSDNRIRMLEVPLLASLELPGGRLRLNLNAGPVINLTTGVSGSYLDPDTAEPLDLGDNGQYRRNVGICWATSLTTTYPIGKARTTQLLLEPFFKHYPRSFTTADAPLSERYWVAGIQLGLRKSF